MPYDSFFLQFLGRVLGEDVFPGEKKIRQVARSILIVKMIAELLGKFTNKICKRYPYLCNALSRMSQV